jgi:ectoine hydroxylase-related dioxygenase (phytanoyl-CoA dioxygenase family)
MKKPLTYATDGIEVFNSFLTCKQVTETLSHLYSATDICSTYQQAVGLGAIAKGTSHHLPAVDTYFVEFLMNFKQIDAYIHDIFGGPYILNSFGGNLNFPTLHNYASKIHRDQRFFSGSSEIIINTFIALVDFTQANGATRIMSKKYGLNSAPPSKDEFYDLSTVIEIPAGSLCIFNSNLWHCAGINTTLQDRPIITPMFSRPMIKPQYDYTSCIVSQNDEYLNQLLGKNSRVPSTLNEWYVQPALRAYKRGQDYDL